MIAALFALMLIAEEPAQVAATTPAEIEKPEKEKKICRADGQETGTRLSQRTCLTRSQWEQRAKAKAAAELKAMGGQ